MDYRPSVGGAAPARLMVTADQTRLAEGTYTSRMNSPQYFATVLNILNANTPVTLNLSEQGLVFIATAGGAQPASQNVQIGTTSSTPVAFQGSTSTDDRAPWLTVKPSSGTISDRTLANAAVAVNASGLTPGIYRGEVDVSISGSLRSTNVTLIVAPAPVAVTKVNAAAGCTATKLAVTHTGLGSGFSAPAKWPVYLEIRLVDNCGEAVTNGQVLVNFSNGDPPVGMERSDDQPGVFTATWSPSKGSTSMTVTATAIVPPLDPATADIVGAVTENKSPSLNADGTVHNVRPLYSGGALAPGTII